MRRLWLAALAAAAIVAVVALRPDEPPASLDAAAAAVVESGVPGVIVRVRDGEQVRELAKGEASVDDRFRIGSVTKTFVAALTLRLADLGTLSLDETVAEFEPDLVGDAAEITIRELLSHRAGLFDYTSDPALLRGGLDPRVLVGIADGMPRATGYAYSSTNYLVLGFVLQRAGLAGLDQMLERQILEPYGLADTTFEPGVVEGSHLHGHERPLRDGIATGSLTDTSDRTARSAWAAGAMVSTAADLDRFFTRLLAGDLGRRMQPRGDDRYGLGLARFETDCGPVVGHTGNLLGTVTVVWARGDRLLVAAANVFPLTPEQETAFQRLLERAFCG
ncbi:MAG TPA: serine hydrolase domain-containing protein [Gaiellaceae bacterium]|nr:serine hydrolase domain-containing protein [Gaiellaceae bacterium]